MERTTKFLGLGACICVGVVVIYNTKTQGESHGAKRPTNKGQGDENVEPQSKALPERRRRVARSDHGPQLGVRRRDQCGPDALHRGRPQLLVLRDLPGPVRHGAHAWTRSGTIASRFIGSCATEWWR